MGTRPRTVVRSIDATEGELRFVIEIAGTEREVWLRSSLPVVAGADVALAITLLPAMTQGGELVIDAPVDVGLLRRIPEIQAVFRSWYRRGDWSRARVFGHELEVVCEAAAPPPRRDDRAIASFFSGGVDSFATVLGNPDVSHLIYVSGFDVPLEHRELDARVRARLGEAAEMLGKSLVTFETNLRELGDDFLNWVAYFGSALAGIARMAGSEFTRVHVASAVHYDHLWENGAHPLLDHLWGGDGLEIVHDGAHLRRVDKIRRLAGSAAARRTLRVCWENPDAAYNCGRCEKCLRTAVALEVLGVRERFEPFPEPPDPERIAALRPANRPEFVFWTENLELAIRERADRELIEAIEACLASVEREAPPAQPASEVDRRARATVRESRPMLYMAPQTWFTLKDKRAVIFLIGSYDGSGNYGDIAQLRAALDLVAELGDEVAVLPVVDLRYLSSHRDCELRPTANFDPALALVFAPPNRYTNDTTVDEGLVPAAVPGACTYAVTYLYGGGYLNSRWADRMLAMVEASTELGLGAGVSRHDRLSTGLQIEPDWAGAVGPGRSELLGGLFQIGTRDELSTQAARLLVGARGSAEVVTTGDDSVGVIARSVNGRPPPVGVGGTSLRINVHVCTGGWVTDQPGRLVQFSARFIDALARASGGRVSLQPVIAYEDQRISERAALQELVEAARGLGRVEAVAEPIVLRPSDLDEQMAILSQAHLTLGSSYHLALTSLLAGLPVLLLRENDYYAQKAHGLRRDFALPEEWFLDPTGDPRAAAESALATLAPPQAEARLRAGLGAARARVVRRRQEVEERVLAYLRAGMEATAPETGRGAVAIREFEDLLAACELAQGRATAFSELADERERWQQGVSDSVSWRITAPLRGAMRLVKGRRRS